MKCAAEQEWTPSSRNASPRRLQGRRSEIGRRGDPRQCAAVMHPLRLQQRLEPPARLLPIDARSGDVHDQGVPGVAVSCRVDVIETQEDKGSRQRDALVAIQKRVVATQVEQIRGRHLGQRLEWRTTKGCRLGRGHGRLEQTAVAQPGRSAERVDDCAVDFLDIRHCQVEAVVGTHVQASFFSVRR